MTRKLTRLAAAVLVALAAAAAAVAAPGTPDVSQMALRSADIPGAKVMTQGIQDVDGYALRTSATRPWSFRSPSS